MSGDTIKGANDVYEKDLYGDLKKSAEAALPLLEELNNQLIEQSKNFDQVLSLQAKDLDSVKRINGAVNNTNKTFRAKVELDKERIAAQKTIRNDQRESLRINKQLRQSTDEEVRGRIRLRQAQKEQRDTLRDLLVLENQESGTLERLEARNRRLRAERRRVNLETEEGRNRVRQINAELDRNNKIIRNNGDELKRQRLNVGNYASAWRNLGATVRTTLTAFGIGGGITVIAQGFRDAFRRVVEFDSALANIRGITGATRRELAPLRVEIINVASESIRTSNEVAELASTLITLGNTQDEVIQLLKPINDLSIALGTSSEEAADFLGQTLNAFNQGAEAGQEFADIVANIRQSTSLDFQRIRDALAFVAPTANALNLTLGRTGALIGVLQDNGIRAARAGRLLNTSFARLISQGLTLNDALELINSSTDRVATSSEIFGAESFTLGLILAENIDKTNELADSFDNLSGGSLKTLTDEQLDTLAGQFKILDSTYEAFILSVESGNGIISRSIRAVVSSFTDLINTATLLNTTIGDFEDAAESSERAFIQSLLDGAETAEEVTSRVTSEITRSVQTLQSAQQALNEFSFARTFFSPGGIDIRKSIEDLIGQTQKRIELLQTALRDPDSFLTSEEVEEVNEQLDQTIEKREKLNDINRIEITQLSRLRTELKQIQSARENLVTESDEQSRRAFNVLTEQAEQLERVIEVYERLLDGVGITIDNQSIEKSQEDLFNRTAKLAEEQGKELEKQQEEQLRKRVERERLAEEQRRIIIAESINAIREITQNASQRRIESIDREIDAINRQNEALLQAEAQGREGAAESLAFQQRQLAELEVIRQRELESQASREIILSGLDIFSQEINSGKNPGEALASTVANIQVLKTILSGLSSFYEGIEDTGNGGNLDGKGGFLSILHPKERVVDAENNKALLDAGIKNSDMPALAKMWKDGFPMDLTKSVRINDVATSDFFSEKIFNKLDDLNRNMVNIPRNMPKYEAYYDDLYNILTTVSRQKGSTNIKRRKLNI